MYLYTLFKPFSLQKKQVKVSPLKPVNQQMFKPLDRSTEACTLITVGI